MLARLLAIGPRSSVCQSLSVTIRYCVKMAERIQLIFGTEASLGDILFSK